MSYIYVKDVINSDNPGFKIHDRLFNSQGKSLISPVEHSGLALFYPFYESENVSQIFLGFHLPVGFNVGLLHLLCILNIKFINMIKYMNLKQTWVKFPCMYLVIYLKMSSPRKLWQRTETPNLFCLRKFFISLIRCQTLCSECQVIAEFLADEKAMPKKETAWLPETKRSQSDPKRHVKNRKAE